MTVETRLQRIRMTLAEYKKLPEGRPYYDFIRGEAIEVNQPSGRHGHVLVRLGNFLYDHVKAQRLGVFYFEIDVELREELWFGPDMIYLSVVHADRYDAASGDLHGVPDLIVEILSPSTAIYDRVEKFNEYFGAGVPWYWLIDQDSLAIEEYKATPEGYVRTASIGPAQVFRPQLFPGLAINLQELL